MRREVPCLPWRWVMRSYYTWNWPPCRCWRLRWVRVAMRRRSVAGRENIAAKEVVLFFWMDLLVSTHPRNKLTWNPKMEVGKMIFLFSWVIFRFHVNFQGCIQLWIFWMDFFFDGFLNLRSYTQLWMVVFFLNWGIVENGQIIETRFKYSSLLLLHPPRQSP